MEIVQKHSAKNWLVSTLACAFLLFSFAANANQLYQANKKSIRFVQIAHGGQIDLVKTNKNGEEYQLRLIDVDPLMAYHAKSLVQKNGLIETEQFIDQWQNHTNAAKTTSTTPNSSLNFYFSDNHAKKIAIHGRLSKPHYNASEESISYMLTLAPHSKINLDDETLSKVVLFIDKPSGQAADYINVSENSALNEPFVKQFTNVF